MIDRNDSAKSWAESTTDILVWPVGAMEQHAEHLPVGTDILFAEYFAKIVAEHFNAALLPVLPIGNSLEHSGFRGTFTLRPETLMHMVRDVAENADVQNFRFLIVVSGHGGNFSLAPACRLYNSENHSLKILLVQPGDFADCSRTFSAAGKTLDIHAGEIETSLYLALGGKLTAQLPNEQSLPESEIRWIQRDLNMFGTGMLNPAGYLGLPWAATAKKGEELLRGICSEMTAYLESRIARLRAFPRYSGFGGLAVRSLCAADKPDLMRIVETVGWNQLENEWNLMLSAAPETSIGVAFCGRIVASACAMAYPDGPAWINLVAVLPAWRGAGLAKRMLAELMNRHGKTRVFKLDATPAGSKVYVKLGFVEESRLVRMVRECAPPAYSASSGRLDSEGMSLLKTADFEYFHADRSALLDWLFQSSPDFSFQNGNANFLLSRPGRNRRHLGPLYAENTESALKLVDSALTHAEGKAAQIDVPVEKTEFIQSLKARGFHEERPFLRMSLHGAEREDFRNAYGIAGPEFG